MPLSTIFRLYRGS